jgi:hypothetical protein
MAKSLDVLRETIQQNRVSGNVSQPTPEKTVVVNRKAELLLAGEVIKGTAEELTVVRQESFAA